MPVGLDDQVVGFDVTVDHAGVMGCLQGASGLRGDRHRLGHVQPADLGDPLRQGLSLHTLHHDVGEVRLTGAGHFPVVVDLGHTRVTQGRHRARLAAEPL
ncbi:hypothetical protein GCM10011576_37880 [Micromonospora parathelypteridis]|nr:hypothetical protein GCM10011576_37880 [Micromonospora parathelypteridis]